MYADCIRTLLSEDGRHQVQLVRKPDLNVAGVMILDAACLDCFSTPAREQNRLIVMAHKREDDLGILWDAGVRHVIFYGDPPERVRLAVLAMELSLSASKANTA